MQAQHFFHNLHERHITVACDRDDIAQIARERGFTTLALDTFDLSIVNVKGDGSSAVLDGTLAFDGLIHYATDLN